MSCNCSKTNQAIADLLIADFAPTANALTKQFFNRCYDEKLMPAVTPIPKPLDLPIFILTEGPDNACANLDAAITKVAVEFDRCGAVMSTVPADSKAHIAARLLRDTFAATLDTMQSSQDDVVC